MSPEMARRLSILRLVLVNFVAPPVIYAIAKDHLSDFVSLILSGIPPTLESIIVLIMKGHFDLISAMVVLGIIVSVIGSVVTQDPRLLLVKDSFGSFIFAVVFIGSAYTKENLIWRYNREWAQGDVEKLNELAEMWKKPGVQKVTNFISIVWGCGFLFECALRILLIYTLDLSLMVYISPVILVCTFLFLGLWTGWYVSYIKRKYPRPPTVPETEGTVVAVDQV